MNGQLEIPMQATPRTRVRLPIDPHDAIPRTAWNFAEYPPMSGFWEVRSILDDDEMRIATWWYDAVKEKWTVTVRDDADPITVHEWKMAADVFTGTHGWRGLMRPSPEVYPTPPYDGPDLVARAQEAGVSIRTTYITITPASYLPLVKLNPGRYRAVL